MDWFVVDRQMVDLGEAVGAVAQQAAEDVRRAERLLARVQALQRRLSEGETAAGVAAQPRVDPAPAKLELSETTVVRPLDDPAEPAGRSPHARPGRASMRDRVVADLFRTTDENQHHR